MAKQAMTKTQIISTLAERTGLAKKEVQQVLDELADLAYKEAGNGFKVPGLGKLELKDRKGRWGRNPRTGEKIWIEPKKTLKFRVAKTAKDAVLG